MQSATQVPRASGPEPIIKVSHLTKRFAKGSELAAVDDISFEVEQNEVVTLFGPSGCGKTTTLRCIAGLEKPDSGEISIGGKIVTSTERGIFLSPEKRSIGLVFQSYALWPHLRVFDNVAFGLRVKHVQKAEIDRRVRQVLEIIGLTGFEARYPAQLSGGQQQRVALARSMVYEPKVLLLDEPLSNLDAKVRDRTRIELSNLLKKVGIASVYVTHDQEEAFQVSDRIVVMNAGRIMQVGNPYVIYHTPANEFVASFVGRSTLLAGRVSSVGQGGNGGLAPGVVRLFGNYDIDCRIPDPIKEGEECVVMVRANEVGIYTKEPSEKWVKGKVVSRMYKGAMTDHIVDVGGTSLVVSTHRFCSLNDTSAEAQPELDRYIVIRGESVSVVPKANTSTKPPGE